MIKKGMVYISLATCLLTVSFVIVFFLGVQMHWNQEEAESAARKMMPECEVQVEHENAFKNLLGDDRSYYVHYTCPGSDYDARITCKRNTCSGSLTKEAGQKK